MGHLLAAILGAGKIEVFPRPAAQPFLHKVMVEHQRLVTKNIFALAQQDTQPRLKVRKFILAPVKHAAQRLRGDWIGTAQHAADGQPPAPGIVLPIREEPIKPQCEHLAQTLLVVAAHIQRALVQQQACQHLCIQEDTLTARRNLFQRLRPCRVIAELFFQCLPVIGTDILQIVLILAVHLDAQGIFRIVFHGRHITGHDQNMQPPRQAVGIPCNRLGQRVFLWVAALFQTVQNDAHGRVISVDSLAQRSCDELVEQFLFRKLSQRGAVFLIQLPQQALAVGRQTAGQQISKCLNHDTGACRR